MSSTPSLRRLVGGLGLLLIVALVAVAATTTVFAYSTSTDTANLSGRPVTNGLNTAGGIPSAIFPASAVTYTASYGFASTPNDASGIAASAPTSIRVMYQQWRHDTQNDWFYIYAVNSNSSTVSGIPVFDYYYYTPGRGATRIAASRANAVAVASGDGKLSISFVFLTSTTNVPAFGIESVTATNAECTAAALVQCPTFFEAQLRWGIAAQGFKSGNVILSQAVESFNVGKAFVTTGAGFSSSAVYYDAFESPFQSSSDTKVALSNTNPAATAANVTNATGNRQANLASSYDMVQTVTDANGDLNHQSLTYVNAAGEWFIFGTYQTRTTGGHQNGLTVTVFYQSWNEAAVYTTSGSQLTTNYLNTLSTTLGTVTQGDQAGASRGVFSQVVTYQVRYSSAARGTWTVVTRAEDWHGGSSGNVTVGTQVIA